VRRDLDFLGLKAVHKSGQTMGADAESDGHLGKGRVERKS
jgi:hypothetical protein